MDMFSEINYDESFFIPEARTNENLQFNYFPNFEPQEISNKDFNVSNEIIKFSPQDIQYFLSLFQPTSTNLNQFIKNIFHSPFVSDTLYQLVKNWYMTNPDNNEEDLRNVANFENHPENSNSWLFPILTSLPEQQRNFIWEVNFNNTYNTNATIDFNDEFTLSSFRNKNYEKTESVGVRVGDVFTDIKRVCCYILRSNCYYVKHDKCLEKLSFSQISQLFKQIKIGSYQQKNEKKSISLFDILNSGKNINYITYDDMKFYSDNPRTFSFFKWYRYPKQLICDQTLIQPFLDHLYQIICNQDSNLYQYIVSWISFLFQIPNAKLCTCLIIIGNQGCGKNTFSNCLCELLGQYSNPNCNFESLTSIKQIQHKKLIVCSESLNYYQNRSYAKQHEKIKTLITESIIDDEENVSNFMILSNK